MCRHSLVIAACFLFDVWVCEVRSAPTAPATNAKPKHLVAAEELVSHLDLANTDYAHGAPQVSFTAPLESHADCSGFADSLLEHCYGFDKKAFRSVFASGRPSAARYYDAIEKQIAFEEVKHVQDAQPGDFLAVKYLTRKDNTGHVMLVAARPVRMEPPREPSKTGPVQWRVEVIDSSESGHGPTDTRHRKGANGKDHDGLGEGVFRIYSSGTGDVTGFSWSTMASSKFKSPQDETLVIGRLRLPPSAAQDEKSSP